MTKLVFIEKRHRKTPILNAHHSSKEKITPGLSVFFGNAGYRISVILEKCSQEKIRSYFQGPGTCRVDPEPQRILAISSLRAKDTSTMWCGWYLVLASRNPGSPISLSLLIN